MTTIGDILDVMYETALKVSEHVVPADRASSTDIALTDFIVVSLPSVIVNKEMSPDMRYNYIETTGVFDVFVKDKMSARNPNAVSISKLSSMVNDLMRIFPVKKQEKSVKLSGPRNLIPVASDYRGYHYSRIQCNITTLV